MENSKITGEKSEYHLLQLLERGTSASVYLGESLSDRSQVAVKLFRIKLTGNDMQKFLDEVRLIATLQNQPILPIHDYGIKEEQPFIVTDPITRDTLRQRYALGTRLPLDTVLYYVKQIADALTYTHGVQLIHGDLNPNNILVGLRSDDILLCNFSMTVLMSRADVIKPYLYLAPEQFDGSPKPASDQYALGVIVYEWLSGFLPFYGSLGELAEKHKSEEPPSIRERSPEISYAIDKVLLRALAKNPQDRFDSVQAFAMHLERACQQQNGKSSRRTILISLLGLVGVAVAEGNAGRIEASLQQSVATLFTYHGHADKIAAVEWSPDGRYLASTSYDKTIQIWRPGTDSPVFTYQGHRDVVRTLAWSPDSKYIASAGEDKIVHVWLTNSQDDIITYTYHSDTISTIAWSPNGTYIASAGADNTVRIWLATESDRSGDIVYLHDGVVNALAWSDDGRYLASASDDHTVRVWDIDNKSFVFTKDYNNGNRVLSVTLGSKATSHIAASGGSDKQIHVWDFVQRQRLSTYSNHSDRVNALLWSTNVEHVISASADTTVQVWHFLSKVPLMTYRGHSDEVSTISQSPDGKFIASGSFDTTIQIWRVI